MLLGQTHSASNGGIVEGAGHKDKVKRESRSALRTKPVLGAAGSMETPSHPAWCRYSRLLRMLPRLPTLQVEGRMTEIFGTVAFQANRAKPYMEA